MKAPEALQAIFAEATWQLDPLVDSSSLLASTVVLENFTVSFTAYNEDELFVSTKIADLPVDSESRFTLLKLASTMCAALWQHHGVNLSITQEQLNLELVVYPEREDFIAKVSVFLDDCDYFVESLEAVKSGSQESATSSTANPLLDFKGGTALWG